MWAFCSLSHGFTFQQPNSTDGNKRSSYPVDVVKRPQIAALAEITMLLSAFLLLAVLSGESFVSP